MSEFDDGFLRALFPPLMWHYLLDEKDQPYEVYDTLEWGRGMEELFNSGRIHVAETWIEADGQFFRVSTVFLGLDHGWPGKQAPILYETMIFGHGDWGDVDMARYHTREEAMNGHIEMVTDLLDEVSVTLGPTRILTDPDEIKLVAIEHQRKASEQWHTEVEELRQDIPELGKEIEDARRRLYPDEP